MAPSCEGVDVAPALVGERFALRVGGQGRRRSLRARAANADAADRQARESARRDLRRHPRVPAAVERCRGRGDRAPRRRRGARRSRDPANARLVCRVRRAGVGAGSSRVSLDGPAAGHRRDAARPRPEDWPIWRRTYDSAGFSPLREIDRDNVGQARARLARAARRRREHGVAAGVRRRDVPAHLSPTPRSRSTPSNGAVLWSHRYEPKTKSSKKMGIALHGDRVFVPTSDLHLLALDARTGALIWDHAIADRGGRRASSSSCAAVRWSRAAT